MNSLAAGALAAVLLTGCGGDAAAGGTWRVSAAYLAFGD
jgi:hypothetical protein